MIKTCVGPCERDLEVNEENFYRQSNGRGFQSRCKQCFAKQVNGRALERYATDDEYRQKVLDKASERYYGNPEYRASKIAAAAKRAMQRYEEDREGWNAYSLAHYHVKKVNGPASSHLCVCGCGRQATDWAMKNDSKSIKASKNYKWSTDVNDYMPMTRSCHKKYDLEAKEVTA